jgi:Ser/Thr protein kinase RdoA (MazF antagonist)
VHDREHLSQPIAELLARWDIPAGAAVARTERGTNNHTLQVTAGDRRWALRISHNLSSAQVLAEHRLLARPRCAGGFRVPGLTSASSRRWRSSAWPQRS